MKLLDHYLSHKYSSSILLSLALTYAGDESADKVHLPGDLANELDRKNKWRSIIKQVQLRSLAYAPDNSGLFSKNMDKIVTSCCDGDIAFT